MLWKPRRVELADVAPRTPLDSQLRDFLCRIVEQAGTITIPLDDTARAPGSIQWKFAATPVGAREVTIWFEPS